MNEWLIGSLVLFAAGLIIAVIEVVLPSAGILAIAAIGCLIGSLVCAYQYSMYAAVVVGVIEAVIVPTAIVIAFKVLPKTTIGRQLILSAPGESKPKKLANPIPPSFASASVSPTQIGMEGSVVTMLRPSGTAEFGGRRVSVVSSGEVIAVGARVRVVLIEGTRIVVEEIRDPASAS
ncbi:MAG: hypothetical protein HS101_17760 [Planctomycetia bacterium]|jgi:membrane-bound serine protease (ClpP class)|nr:hypothetical protein [Planctomycetia bacterium]MCC7314779.1 hypothetical protein [Planctomycetota bacterium]